METQVEIKTPIHLEDQVKVEEGKVARKVLLFNDKGLVQLLTFARGANLTPHTANGDIVVTVISGRLNFNVDGKEHEMKTGDSIVVPANTEHAVSALEDTRVLLAKIG